MDSVFLVSLKVEEILGSWIRFEKNMFLNLFKK